METPETQQQYINDLSISRIREKQRKELENLTLATQPIKTLTYFVLAIVQCLQRLFAKSGWLLLLISAFIGSIGILVITTGSPYQDHVQEVVNYLRFGLWWLALGVASSIGLGSGLHTFVLYLGPHVALFTIKAVQCGRVDIKSAVYDTIQLYSGPSWLDRNCTAFGPPMYSSLEGSRIPLTSILPQIQLEAVLWGIGTALGELPPYFISRAASISGSKREVMKEFESFSPEDHNTVMATHINQIKNWLLSHSQYLNFFSILVLASVPNPLFDLAGIMCGQFGVPFWKFFLATLIGKAIIKTHIQTAFIISVCNHQLLDLIENELIRLLSFVPGLATVLPKLIAKLQIIRSKYMAPTPPVSNVEVKKWDFSFASIWNTVIWLMLISFFFKIVTETAQSFLKERHEKELTLSKSSSASGPSSSKNT
ncbi:PREDICTED: vacuole membrane protein KMS1-like [Populus euphratica]|uniref:Vacuole membrane protein KMS1-like n=1 Tax=Populus euphratica TaxID=75702 RepID=A0AAJ6XM07_POPEU|nr:PREDICTED: vacuole membrane protein KMS1-like [Populus euphratica]